MTRNGPRHSKTLPPMPPRFGFALRGLSFILALGLALACSKKQETLPKDDEIVARVNGTPITRYDVEYSAQRSLGDLALPSVERRAFAKLVEASVQSRAIALEAERELTPVEKLALEKEVAAYREQLLVRRYLAKHNPPRPVTPEMVATYYKSYPERFGGGKAQSYEIVGSTRAPSPEERARLLGKLDQGRAERDWKAWALALERDGLPVTYMSVTDQDRMLHGKLRELVVSLVSGSVSPVAFVQGRAYIARVAGETRREPKPLAEAREEIERLLMPAQYSAAIASAAENVLKNTKVELVVNQGAVAHAAPSAGSKLVERAERIERGKP